MDKFLQHISLIFHILIKIKICAIDFFDFIGLEQTITTYLVCI